MIAAGRRSHPVPVPAWKGVRLVVPPCRRGRRRDPVDQQFHRECRLLHVARLQGCSRLAKAGHGMKLQRQSGLHRSAGQRVDDVRAPRPRAGSASGPPSSAFEAARCGAQGAHDRHVQATNADGRIGHVHNGAPPGPVGSWRHAPRRSDLAGDNAEQRLGDAKPDARDGFRSLS
jgi:hypothetical protein